MSSVNKAILVGNVGSIDERTMQSGDKVVNISLATSESWKDKATGEKREKTEWHKIVVYNQSTVNFVSRYVSKGDKLYIEGRLETRSWEQDGQKKYTTEIVIRPFIGEVVKISKSDAQPEQNIEAGGYGGSDLEDEIPFMRHLDFIGGL